MHCGGGHTDVVELLLERKADPNIAAISVTKNDELPPLTVVAWGPLLERIERRWPEREWPSNVTIVRQKMPLPELRRLMATTGIHVCPSACEGFGHSINEARSLGAVVVTTDAPPMNELVTDGEDGKPNA